MRIEESSLRDLDKIGIYKIRNIITQKVYIGHTKKSFISRFQTHYMKLKNNNHKGYWHLQSASNQYGIENFEFSIIEICKENKMIERETFWIAYFDATNRDKGYNINKYPEKSPILTKEVRDRMTKTLREGYKSGRLKPNKGIFKKGIIPWNKGGKYQSTDHLKVKKMKRGSRENFSKTIKEKQIPVEVFNINGEKIGEWRYTEDVIKEALNTESILCKSMILHNPKGRNGYLPNQLFAVNINKSRNNGTSYKGLYFKYKTIAHNKSDKLLETPNIELDENN